MNLQSKFFFFYYYFIFKTDCSLFIYLFIFFVRGKSEVEAREHIIGGLDRIS